MDNDFVKRQYDLIADEYMKSRDAFNNSHYLDRLLSLLSPESLILDIGCGPGVPIDRYLANHHHDIIGIDISRRQIALAREHVPEGDYSVKDMSTLREGEYTVDAVVSFYAIFHTPRETHQSTLHKIYSFLKPGGYMLITMGSTDWVGKEQDFFGSEMYWSHYDAKKNRELVDHAGFTVILDEIDTTAGEKHQIILARKA